MIMRLILLAALAAGAYYAFMFGTAIASQFLTSTFAWMFP